jgi:hypothetical protein
MSLVNTPSTKTEGECHSSIFYGLFENEKMNEWHVTTTRNTAENKEGKQECVDLEAFIYDFTYYESLKSMEIVFFIWMVVFISLFYNDCGRRDATQERVLTTTTTTIEERRKQMPMLLFSIFTHYQSWKSMKVVFFQMLEMSSFVMWWRNSECWRCDMTCDMSDSTHDNDDNDDTTTINRKWFTKLKYINCLLLLVWLLSFIKLSFLFGHFSICLALYSISYSQYDWPI